MMVGDGAEAHRQIATSRPARRALGRLAGHPRSENVASIEYP